MNRIMAGVFLLLGLLASTRSEAGVSSFPGTSFGAIPDGSATGPASYGQPRDVEFAVTGLSGTVDGVGLVFSASHSLVGDLRVRLIAPNGKEHLIFARTLATTAGSFGSGANLLSANSYRFGDSFATNWWSAVDAAGVNIPSTEARTVVSGGAGVTNPAAATSMNNAFRSTPPNGTWILRFEDGALGDTGTVTAATLDLSTSGISRLVTTNADSGTGSLREVMQASGPGDLIEFADGPFGLPQTIELVSPLPDVSTNLAIRGPGAHLLTLKRAFGAPDFRIFSIFNSTDVSIAGMGISNGRDVDAGGIVCVCNLTLSNVHVFGNTFTNTGTGAGGITAVGNLALVDSTVSGNTGYLSGGIEFFAQDGRSLRILGSTISGNRTTSDAPFPIGGSGITYFAAGPGVSQAEIINSTVVDNQSGSGGAGIDLYAQGAGAEISLLLRNSIVADNLPSNLNLTENTGGVASITSMGFNLSNDFNGIATAPGDLTAAPGLGPLVRLAAGTPGHLPLGGSPALDAGNSSGAARDQRGQPRLFDIGSIANAGNNGNGSDIGAVEVQAIMVSNANDAGPGSLREAIVASNANGQGLDDIVFADAPFASPQTIGLTSAYPVIFGALTVSGNRADRLTVRRESGGQYRVFEIGSSGSSGVSLSGLTIADGDLTGAGDGGGIKIQSTTVSIADSVITGNQATSGAGVANFAGALTITGSTLSNNSAQLLGGAVLNFNGYLNVVNSTISGNQTGIRGSGILNSAAFGGNASFVDIVSSTIAENVGPANSAGFETETQDSAVVAVSTLRNSILAGNLPQSLLTNIFSGGGPVVVQSKQFNLASDSSNGLLNFPSDLTNANAGLAPLANNGGPTPTHSLLAGSDAIDAGNNQGSGYLADQRGPGYPRPYDQSTEPNATGGDGSDMGAFELQERPLFADGFDG